MKAGQFTTWSPDTYDLRRRRAAVDGYVPLLAVAIAVGAGIAVDRCVVSLGMAWLLVAVAALASWLIAWRRYKNERATMLLLLAVFALAAGWGHANWRLFSQHELGRFANQLSTPVCVEAIATESAETRAAPPPNAYRAIPQGETSRLRLQVIQLRNGQRWQSAAGECDLVIDGHLTGIRPGDRLRLFAQMREPAAASNPGQSSYAKAAQRERRLAMLRTESPDCVAVIARGESWSLRKTTNQIRQQLRHTINTNLPPHEASLAMAMLLGDRDQLSQATAERFRRTGAMHVLVVSGLHVGTLAAAFYLLMRWGWVPRRRVLSLVMGLALVYAIVAGGRPPVIRAVVLAEAVCLAMLTGRRAIALNSLAAGAIIVLAINPSDLFGSGPQLSFLATATLISFGTWHLRQQKTPDPIDRLLISARPWYNQAVRGVGSAAWLLIAATAAVWCTSAPLLLHEFHLLSPVAIPMSVAVFPLVAVIVTSGFAMLVSDLIFPTLASYPAGICEAATHWLDRCLAKADALPLAHGWFPAPDGWWTLGVYAMLATAALGRAKPWIPKLTARLALAWIPLAFVPSLVEMTQERPLRCTTINVGHGVSVLIETPSGANLLYDAGSLGSPDYATETIAGVLWSRGITRIDALLLSHADVDHFNGTPGLLDRFDIRAVYTPPRMLPPADDTTDRSAPAALARLLAARQVPLNELALGDRLNLGDTKAEVLHPNELGVIDTDNANSLVLAIEHAGRRLLLPGDLEGAGMTALLMQEPYHCDVLLAPHHGSRRSDPPGFAAWCSPRWVVVSGGLSSNPAATDAGQSYAQAGANVVRTSQLGAITLLLGERGIDCKVFRER